MDLASGETPKDSGYQGIVSWCRPSIRRRPPSGTNLMLNQTSIPKYGTESRRIFCWTAAWGALWCTWYCIVSYMGHDGTVQSCLRATHVLRSGIFCNSHTFVWVPCHGAPVARARAHIDAWRPPHTKCPASASCARHWSTHTCTRPHHGSQLPRDNIISLSEIWIFAI